MRIAILEACISGSVRNWCMSREAISIAMRSAAPATPAGIAETISFQTFLVEESKYLGGLPTSPAVVGADLREANRPALTATDPRTVACSNVSRGRGMKLYELQT